MPETLPRSDLTREKVLDAAEQLFAERGFNAVSVREITGAAEVHLSAVNYYFGSKKNLYLQVFKDRVLPRLMPFSRVLEKLEQEPEIDLPSLVRTLALAFIRGGHGRRSEMAGFAPLLFREMAHPGEAFDLLVDGFIRPTHEKIAALLGRGMEREVEQERLVFYSMTLMTLLRHLAHSKAVIRRIFERDFDEKLIERLIGYLTDFMMHGLALEEKP